MPGKRPWIWCSEFKRLLQTNLGRSRQAQDLLFQTIRESGVALAVVDELYRVPDTPDWVGDLNGLIAITWTSALGAPGDIAAAPIEWTGTVTVGDYVSPNSGMVAFGDFLDEVGECVRR
jgi:hypothetical protein